MLGVDGPDSRWPEPSTHLAHSSARRTWSGGGGAFLSYLACLVLGAIVLNTIGRVRPRSMLRQATRMEGDAPPYADSDGDGNEDAHA
jgi:hypothetical protein